ncbi:MAG: hypothetical protein MI919_30605 [Holophagales bacterium]|nr:hypothetical protein [Holophagales bacterium]
MIRARALLPATALALVALHTLAVPTRAADIVLVNLDPPGVGLNDPTPVAPVGGNPGTTLGEQRIHVYLHAARIWGDVLDSAVPILVGATFLPLPCEPTTGILGGGGPITVFADFPGALVPDTWYVSSLADALAGTDLDPGNLDIITLFNSDVDDDPACLTDRVWYYGLDNAQGGDVDFLTVVVHEINHGLGHLELMNGETGELLAGRPDAYLRHMLDLDLGGTWDTLTHAERLTSQVNTHRLVWRGSNVTSAAADALGPRPSLRILRPKSLRGTYEVQQAAFGASLQDGARASGRIVLADDRVGSGSDACEPIQNNLKGKIALVDRGGECTDATKATHAQEAGAKGVIIANDEPGVAPRIGGSAPSVTIPTISVSLELGEALEAELPKVKGKIFADPRILAGTSDGFVRLFAPDPVRPGSSKSHWDTTALPNLLMEPSVSPDLESATTLDLSPSLLLDLGWPLLP